MLRKRDMTSRNQMEMITLDTLVPANHLVRKIDAAINFDFVYDLVEDLYSEETGRPSLDPVLLIKIPLIQYTFGIRSMRQTIKEIETNVAYRWFLGLGLNEGVPHFSTFGKNYARRFEGTKIFESIFNKILSQGIEEGFIDPSVVFIDGTHVKASANKNKRMKVLVKEETRLFKSQLEKEINVERKKHGQKPLKKNEKSKVKTRTTSPIDPDCGMFWKTERERMLCYSFSTACDRHGFILGNFVSAGNVHDSKNFEHLFKDLISRFTEITAMAADAGYLAPQIPKMMMDQGIRSVLPYKRPMTKDGFFKKYEYVYDEFNDFYICPNNKELRYTTTNRQGKKEYKSNPKDCKHCEFLNQCTHSQNNQKVVERHIWQEAMDEAMHLRHTDYNRTVYKKRSETIERVFADAKEKHGMRYTQYRGKRKVSDHAMLLFACMNLKKMANWKWQRAA